MKIAVTGTHSTGKTTLANAISQAYDIPLVRGDKAIDICTSLYPSQPINQLTVRQQWILQQKMFESFDDAFSIENCVTDGFHLTCIPYGSHFTNGRMRFLPEYNSFAEKVLERSRQFDIIFYLPPEIDLADNNFRPKSDDLRWDIDKDLRALLLQYKPITLTGTVEQRIAKAGTAMGRMNDVLQNYIVLEGLPRSGKTTQLRQVQERAKKEGVKLHVCQRNNSKYMREFKKIRAYDPYCNSKELLELNIEALKYDIQQNDVIGRVAKGEIVVADRQKYIIMTMFAALGVPMHELYESLYGLPNPGKVLFLDIDTSMSVKRAGITKQKSPLKHNEDFQNEVKRLYEELSILHNFTYINANKPVDEVTEEIWKQLQ